MSRFDIAEDHDLSGTEGALYLRKSRKDIEAERAAADAGRPYDTLQKHRIELFRLVRDMHLTVVEVIEEMESGEYIAERPKMQQLLEDVQDGRYTWVMVMDEDRLGRGSKTDQGRIENTFKNSDTLIITPGKIVDMNNEADELYMEFKGMGARYELKQIKKRLQGGRRRSAAQGNYIGKSTPFGYIRGIDLKTNYPLFISNYAEKASEIENLRLYPHPEQAEFVRMMYEWLISGVGVRQIAVRITQLTITTPGGKQNWARSTVTRIMKNRVYLGEIRWGKTRHIKNEDGTYNVRKVDEAQITVMTNAHAPLVSEETFYAAQTILESRYTPPVNQGKEIVNPFAGLILCEYCSLTMSYQPRYQLTRNPRMTCMNPHCKKNRSVNFDLVEQRVLEHLREYYKTLKTNPRLVNISKSSRSIEAFEKMKANLTSEAQNTRGQMDSLHSLLERGVYSVQTFLDRQKAITDKIAKLEEDIQQVEDDIAKEKDKEKKRKQVTPLFDNVLRKYEQAESAGEKNKLLRSIIRSIYYSKPNDQPKNEDFRLRIVWID